MHHDGGERLGPDVRALHQAVGEEERRHQRPDAAQERRQETEDGADQDESPQRGPARRAGPQVAPRHGEQQEHAEQARQRGQRRGGEQEAPDERQRHGPDREPADHAQVELVPVEPDAAGVPDQLGDGQDRDRVTDPEGRDQHGQQDGGSAEPGDRRERRRDERGDDDEDDLGAQNPRSTSTRRISRAAAARWETRFFSSAAYSPTVRPPGSSHAGSKIGS